MTRKLTFTVLGIALILSGALAAPAQAATGTGTASTSEPQPKAAKVKKKSTKVKYDKGSGETTSERDRRLYRECKGRPNGGACLGYAS